MKQTFTLLVIIALSLLSTGAKGQTTVGDFSVTGDQANYSFNSDVLTITGGTDVVVSMETPGNTTNHRIVVDADATVTLNGVSIETTADAPLSVKDNVTLTLKLKGENKLITTASGKAGIQMGAQADITIDSDAPNNPGALEAKGGYEAAGIGGASMSSSSGDLTSTLGNITIKNSRVKATGGTYAAGIGSGYFSNTDAGSTSTASVGDIKIQSSQVTAMGGDGGSGIGGGMTLVYTNLTTSIGNITIEDSQVTATTNDGKGGIGTGANASSASLTYGTLTINQNSVVKAAAINYPNLSGLTQSIVFEGQTGTVYGTPTLTTNLTVGKDTTLTVPAGTSITVGTGGLLEVKGTLKKEGNGAVANTAGEIKAYATATLDGDPLTRLTASYEIDPSKVTLTMASTELEHTGQPLKPAYTVTIASGGICQGGPAFANADTTSVWSDNTDIGTAKLTLNLKPGTSFFIADGSSKLAEATFEIKEKKEEEDPSLPAPAPSYTWHKVTIPAVEGILIVRNGRESDGYDIDMLEGALFSFSLKGKPGYDLSAVVVTTNKGEVLTPREDGKYVIPEVMEDLTIHISSVPLGNEAPETNGVRIYTESGTLHIELNEAQQVHVFSAAGALLHSSRMNAGHNSTSLPAGIYLVRLANGKVVKIAI